jgi:hypothetical protein
MPHVNDLHEQHDPILVVSLASRDFAAADRDRATAQALVDSCADCAALHDDILAIARATKALPAAARPRDFQLSPEQAAKLRPAGWRRLIAGLAAPGPIFSRQLGLGLATLGIAGLLIGALPSVQLGMGSSAGASAAPAAAGAPAYESASQPAALEPAPQASAAASAAAERAFSAGGPSEPKASLGPINDQSSETPAAAVSLTGGDASKPSPPAADGTRNAEAPTGTDRLTAVAPTPAPPNGPSGLVIVSVALLFAGILVLLVRSIARRSAAA